MPIVQVAYERVNLADIETSSDEDDYGDLFAHVSWKNIPARQVLGE